MNINKTVEPSQDHIPLKDQSANPQMDLQTEISYSLDNLRNFVDDELNSFQQTLESGVLKGVPTTDIPQVTSNLFLNQNKEQSTTKANLAQTLPQTNTDSAENSKEVLSLLKDVTRLLSENASQQANSQATKEAPKESKPVAEIPAILTDKINSNSDTSQKIKNTHRKRINWLFCVKVIVLALVFFALTFIPTYQIKRQFANLSNLTMQLGKISRNYRSGVTTIDSISAFDSEHNTVYQTGKATFSGLPLFSAKQIHINSAWIEGVRFVPQKQETTPNNVEIANTFSSVLASDYYNSDAVVAAGDVSEYLFAESTYAYLSLFLNNLEKLASWLPANIRQCMGPNNSLNTQADLANSNQTNISIDNLHLSGETVFMGKPTVFAIDITNYSSYPSDKPMNIELAFGENRTGNLTIDVIHHEKTTELQIRWKNAESMDRFAYGKSDGLRIFQNDQKAENCVASHEIKATVINGYVKGEMTMTQKVGKAIVTLSQISNPEDVEKLQTTVAGLGLIMLQDKFEGMYRKPTHHIESNLESIGQSTIEIAKNLCRDRSNSSQPKENLVAENTSTELQTTEANNVPDTNNKTEIATESSNPTISDMAENVVVPKEEPQIVADDQSATEENSDSVVKDIVLTISEEPNIPLTAPNSPAVGSQVDENKACSNGSTPPLPIVVENDEEDEEVETAKTEEPAACFRLSGRSKRP